MFRWYQRATNCYVYLSDVHIPDEVIDVQAFRITWRMPFDEVDGSIEVGLCRNSLHQQVLSSSRRIASSWAARYRWNKIFTKLPRSHYGAKKI
ncbi:hypothetical protein B0O99DRAFT_704039 [Bisporella sp. PMI_857]|nr:hypothetical protein B0O99DRAFT_704039 [Bisporella sp. PMI_857]